MRARHQALQEGRALGSGFGKRRCISSSDVGWNCLMTAMRQARSSSPFWPWQSSVTRALT